MIKRVIGAAGLVLMSAGLAQADGLDVGRRSNGTLAMLLEVEQPFPLPPSVFVGVNGYATGLLGFGALFHDEPAEDLFRLNPACDLRCTIVGIDPGVVVYEGLTQLSVGATVVLGPPEFDVHLIYSIAGSTPWQVGSVQVVLHDVNGVHADSQPITVSFIAVPPACPGDANGNLSVTFADVTSVLTNFGATYPVTTGGPGDADRSGAVTFADVTSVLTNFAATCTP